MGPDHLEPLLQHALKIVPTHAVEDTPVFLLATAGMRLVSNVQREALLKEICSYTRTHSNFLLPDCDLHIQVIPGETEGLYGWIAANYLLGGFDSPEEHVHGKGHHTYGFLDMGGASAQIAFAPNSTEAAKHANDLKLLRLRTVDGGLTEYKVFVTTWLGFGVNEARRRYVEALVESLGSNPNAELPDPCLPNGLRTTTTGKLIEGSAPVGNSAYLLGTGNFEECLRQTWPLLEKFKPCDDDPCLLGVHVPAIDFNVNHFIGISEYWHTTHEIFEMGHKDKAYDFHTYQTRVTEFCSQSWNTIEDGISDKKWGKKVDEQTAYEVCFKASWLINVLHDGIGIPREGLENTNGSGHNGTKEVLEHGKEKGFLDPFQAVNKIEHTEVSWALGKMVLYAASQIPPVEDSLPVGFGSNQAGIPPDFQYPGGASWPSITGPADDAGSEDWHDTLFNSDSPRRIPGFLLFMLIVCIAVFFLCGRDRRTRLYRKVFGAPGKRRILGGKIPFLSRGPSAVYERVLEEGGPGGPQDFELGEVESDDSDASGSSRLGRTGSWATSRGKPSPFESSSATDLGLGGSPRRMDRDGLVVRTESRERLTPTLGTTSNGRKSRTGSPTRSKASHTMSSLAED